MAAIKIEMFLLQATSMEGRSPWDLEIQDLLKELLINFKEGKYAPAKPASAVTP